MDSSEGKNTPNLHNLKLSSKNAKKTPLRALFIDYLSIGLSMKINEGRELSQRRRCYGYGSGKRLPSSEHP